MDFLDFIKNSPTSFHAVSEIKKLLEENGFKELDEKKAFSINLNSKYFIIRNGNSIIAFTTPSYLESYQFNITAAHTDSPTFKLKPNFALSMDRYNYLNTEVYGGLILNTFFDRPLNIAGRVMVKNGDHLEAKLINFNRFMCMIPNLSIHFNRDVNNGVAINPQNECLPILSEDNGSLDLYDAIADELGVKKEDIVSHDLYLAILDRGMVGGLNNEFIMAPQIDNLECAYALTMGLIGGKCEYNTINVMALFDSEEVGSASKSAADSKFLEDTLYRISRSMDKCLDEHMVALNNSFMISADNAHAFHPAYSHRYDPTNRVYMNDGIVIKSAANGSYTTDGYSEAIFKMLCDKAEARYQIMTNRSDVRGGSTLGHISLAHLSVSSVDIGLPQLAMHSAMETCGKYDLDDLIKVAKEFYSTHITFKGENNIEIG